MSTLRAVWEKPDYTGVIAEAPLATLVPPYLALGIYLGRTAPNRYFALNIPPDGRWRLLSFDLNAPELETCRFLRIFGNEIPRHRFAPQPTVTVEGRPVDEQVKERPFRAA
jgi:hypothetical protein